MVGVHSRCLDPNDELLALVFDCRERPVRLLPEDVIGRIERERGADRVSAGSRHRRDPAAILPAHV